MSLKIKVSYETESELDTVLNLLKPVLPQYKIKKSTGSSPYKHLYLIPRNIHK